MQVPALVLPDGEMLTELAVIVQYLADRHPESRFLAEAGSSLRRKQEEWLSFLSGELHKSIFYIFYHPSASPAVKDFARSIADRPLTLVSDALADRPYLTGEYSVADMLLLVMLIWIEPAGLKLSNWPVLEEYRARLFQRDALRTAVFSEKLLFEPA
jgi:glutathione S-transferase